MIVSNVCQTGQRFLKLGERTRACVSVFQSCLLHSGDMLDSSIIMNGKMPHLMVPGNSDHKNERKLNQFQPENNSPEHRK